MITSTQVFQMPKNHLLTPFPLPIGEATCLCSIALYITDITFHVMNVLDTIVKEKTSIVKDASVKQWINVLSITIPAK